MKLTKSQSKAVEPIGTGATMPFCTFRLGDALFGVDVRMVKEVTMLQPLTPIAHAPDCIRGLVNLRGQIHLVLDLKRLLNLGQTSVRSLTRLVLFKPALSDPFGVLIDDIGDIVQLRAEQIEDRRERSADGLVAGIGKLDGELLTLLDARKFIPAIENSLLA